MYLYSALFVVPHTQGAQAWITQCYLQLHQCLPLPRTRWRLPRLRLRIPNCSLLVIYLPRKDKRLSRPGWLTYSGRFTHISGHPSAAGQAQDRESSPVKDRRSTNCATQPTKCTQFCHKQKKTQQNTARTSQLSGLLVLVNIQQLSQQLKYQTGC